MLRRILLTGLIAGTAAALVAGQEWWLMTAAATALGLGLLVFVPQRVVWVVGAAILVLPHLVGAPVGPHGASALPAELAAEFATASLATAALFWLLLGGISGWLYRRLE